MVLLPSVEWRGPSAALRLLQDDNDEGRGGGTPSYLVCEDDLAPDGHPLWHPTYSGRLKNPSIRKIKSGHQVMFTHPKQCADALYEFARE
jgi:hypothetical protein